MLWTPEQYTGDIPELVLHRTTRAGELLATVPSLASITDIFLRKIEAKDSPRELFCISKDKGFNALLRVLSYIDVQLKANDQLINTFSNEEIKILTEHCYSQEGEPEITRLIGDGIGAFNFAAILAVIRKTDYSGSTDIPTWADDIADSLDQYTIDDLRDMLGQEWFIEFCRSLALPMNGFLKTGVIENSNSRMISVAIGAYLDFGKYLLLDENGTVSLSDEGKKYLTEVRHKHNTYVHEHEALASGFRGTSSGCPVRHRTFGSMALIGSAHQEDVSMWTRDGIISLSKNERIVTMEYDCFQEVAQFLTRMLDKVSVVEQQVF